MESPSGIILSDSDALIGDIKFIFSNGFDFISSNSFEWVKAYLFRNRVNLLIADLDICPEVQSEILNGLSEFEDSRLSVLFLISERNWIVMERKINFDAFEFSVDRLVKPFSRNDLVSSVDQLCG